MVTWTTRRSRSPADTPWRLLKRATGHVSPEGGFRTGGRRRGHRERRCGSRMSDHRGGHDDGTLGEAPTHGRGEAPKRHPAASRGRETDEEYCIESVEGLPRGERP